MLYSMDSETKPFAVILSLVYAILPCILCYPLYKDRIPNGHSVKNPFDSLESNSIWRGVGHWTPEGGGPRNPFGIAFANNRHVSCFILN